MSTSFKPVLISTDDMIPLWPHNHPSPENLEAVLEHYGVDPKIKNGIKAITYYKDFKFETDEEHHRCKCACRMDIDHLFVVNDGKTRIPIGSVCINKFFGENVYRCAMDILHNRVRCVKCSRTIRKDVVNREVGVFYHMKCGHHEYKLKKGLYKDYSLLEVLVLDTGYLMALMKENDRTYLSKGQKEEVKRLVAGYGDNPHVEGIKKRGLYRS